MPRDTGSIISTCNQGFAFTWSGGPNNYEGALSYYSTLYGSGAHMTYFLNAQATFQGASHCIYDANTVTSLQRAYQEASQIASSGWSNADLTTLTYDEIDVEIGRMNDAISKILGVTPNFYRPPTLTAMNDDVAQYLQQKYGMTVVTWSDDSNDLATNSVSGLETWYTQLSTTRPHISLAHSTAQASVTLAIADAINFWSVMKTRFQLLTVASCLNMTPYTTTTGQFGTRDNTWTCDGTWSPPASSSTTTAATTTTASTTSTTDSSTTSATVPPPDSSTTASSTDTSTTDSTTTTTTTSAPAATETGPATLDSYNGWSSIGCFVDAVDARVLPVQAATAGGAAAMTIEVCLDACHAAGYKFAGAEWSQECYCGNTQPTDEATDGRCDMVCNGNPLEYCGGGNGISVYQYTDTSNEPVTLQTYNDWTYSNCYVDSVADRVLPVAMAVTGAMTAELCLDACYANGYSIAGVEWSQECYCGSSLPTEVATDGTCYMPCEGNALEICGGGLGLSVYQHSGSTQTPSGPSILQSYNGWNSAGCFVDSIDERVLPEQMAVAGGSPMTVELCIDACNAAGYEFAGVEYSQECYCGRSLPTVAATDGRCDMTCAGNSLEYCGGGNGINVYQVTDASAPAVLQSYNGWSSVGCYVDSINARSLPYTVITINGDDMTVESCLTACSSQGYAYAGLEYSQECYCGAELSAEEATDGRCDMVCKGNSLEFCGGGNGLNVYMQTQ